MTALGSLGFTYDASNQPVAVNGTAAGSYAYDGHLRRAKQIVGGVTRYSVYDVSGGLVSIDQAGAGPTEYIRASGMTLARVAGAAVTWLHPDHLGSAVAGTGSTGSVVWRESEQPFGEDWISAPANDNQSGYTGHVEDAATGLVYMQARYYDPVIGRFLANDPVGFTPGRPDMFNRYAYAGNDPVNAVDPDGKDRELRLEKVVVKAVKRVATKLALNFVSRKAEQVAPAVVRAAGEEAKKQACKTPPLGVAFGADAYLGAGATVQGGLSVDPTTGKPSAFLSVGVGAGGAIGPNGAPIPITPFASGIINAPSGLSGNVTGNASLIRGNVFGVSFSQVIAGSSQGGSVAIPLPKPRVAGKGTVPVAFAGNVNVAAEGSVPLFPDLYDAGCDENS